jgi:uncharacterized membrane-anchored protein YitT (DUF2179 family)
MKLPNRRALVVFGGQVLLVLIGEILNAYAFQTLIIPQKLLSGGVVGIALLLNQLFHLPIGVQTLIYNIPIFLLGLRLLGRRFIILSVIGVVSFSFFTDNLRLAPLVDDILLVAVFGGILTGLADGLILRAGGSTGGFDILGLIVSKRFNLAVGQVFMVFNGALLTVAAFVNGKDGPKLAMYTLIMLYVSSRVIDLLQSVTPRQAVLIISSKGEAIATKIIDDLGRGVTYFQGGGAYTDSEMRILLCVITQFELTDLKRLTREVDPKAFTVILDAPEVHGRFDRRTPIQRILG